jgi:hypothetical protein
LTLSLLGQARLQGEGELVGGRHVFGCLERVAVRVGGLGLLSVDWGC